MLFNFDPIKPETIIGISALALLALGFVKKAVALGTLNFYPDKVQQIKFDGATPVMTISLLTQNTSTQVFTIRSISGSLYANDTLVGNIGNFGLLQIQPNSEGIIYITVRMSLIGLSNDIIRAFQFGNFSQDLQLSGFVNVDNYQIPLNMQFKVGMNKPTTNAIPVV